MIGKMLSKTILATTEIGILVIRDFNPSISL